MKKIMFLAVAIIAAAADGSAQETAAAVPVDVKEASPDTGFSVDATLDFFSAYVWRGCVYNDRPVFQPGVSATYATADYGSFGAGMWSNFDLTDRNRQVTGAGLNEIDYQLFYTVDVESFTLEVGHLWYTFPKASGQDYYPSTREVYASVAYNNDVVTPFVSLTYDYAVYDGFYGNAGLNKEFELSDQLTLGAEVSLGAGDSDYIAYVGGDDAGLMDFNASVFMSYALTDTVSLGAKLAWMSLVDSEARDQETYWEEDLLWGGVSVNVSL